MTPAARERDRPRDVARLYEREPELRALLAAVASAKRGTGRTVVVQAAAGVGKTRLLGAALGTARAAGFSVVHATASELERELPFGLALALLERPVAGADDAARAAMLAGSARLAAPMLPGGDGDGGPALGADVAAPEQMALVHALYWVLVNLAAERPLAVVVDDLHWADRPSLHLVAYLARRVADHPILLVAATRPREPAAAQDLLDGLLATPTTVVLRPGVLSPDATRQAVADLLPAPPAAAFTDACVEATGGNPLLLRELMRALAQEGVRGSDTDAARVRSIGPEPVAWSVAATLRHLPAADRAMAHAASVLGDAAPVAFAVALTGLDEQAAREALGRLQHAGLLADGARLRLVHPLVRQALLQTVPAGELGLLHRAAARLHAERGDATPAAAHLVHAPPGGEAWAVDALVVAARQALDRAAPADGARLLARALAEPPDAEARPAVLAHAARAQAAAGEPDAAATFEAALAVAATPDAQAELLLALAWTHQAHGRFADAVQTSARGLALEIADVRVATELAAMHDAAVLWSPSDAPTDARAIATREVRGDSRAERAALADAARRQMFAGTDHAQAAELARRAWSDGRLLAESTADDPSLVRVLTVFHNADALTEALAVADACLRDAHRRASPMAHATWRHLRGHILLYLGQLEESEEDLREAFAAREHGWGAWLPVTAAALATVLLERDDADGAQAVLDAAAASTTHPAASPMWMLTQAASGRLALARGDAQAAVVLLLAAGARAAQELGTTNPALGPWWSDAILGLRRLERTQEALALAALSLERARAWGAPRAISEALRVGALVGAPADRAATLADAVALVAPGEARLEHAHTLVALGVAQQNAGTPDALHTLRLALDSADRCGAIALARTSREHLREGGARPRRTALAGPASLTVSERRVARLAADGLSNRDIADELFVTPKAVAFHLGNVYRKLGIKGRTELADAL